jgi:hypothetical protein
MAKVISVIIFSLFGFFALAQSPSPIPIAPKTETVSNLGIEKVPGLELPPDQTVNSDEGFVTIKAECNGQVKWLVISSLKVKYVLVPQTNSIIISIPPQNGQISVFAIGIVEGKLTDFARTNVNITNGAPVPNPTPTPIPNPTPAPNGAFHVTFFIDLNTMTVDLAQVVNSQTLRQTITSKNGYFRLYDIRSPIIIQKKLDEVVRKVGGNAVMVVQRNDGIVIDARPVPRTENEAIQIINQIIGGR